MYRRTSPAAALLLSSGLLLAPTSVIAEVEWSGSVPREMAIDAAYDLSWTSTAESVKVTLFNRGSDNSPFSIVDILTNAWINNDLSAADSTTDTSFRWYPSDIVTPGLYGLLLTGSDDTTDQTSQFSIVAAGEAPASTTSSSSTSTTSTSQPTSDPTGGSSTTTTDSSTSQPTGSATSTGSPGSGGETSSESSGLSTGAKAGIGVGAAIGGLAIMGAIGFFLFRLGKKSGAGKKDDDEKAEEGEGKSGDTAMPKEAEMMGDSTQPMEAKDSQIAEMQAPDVIHEAPDYKQRLDTPNTFMAELDATGGSFVISRPGSAVPLADKSSTPTAGSPEPALSPATAGAGPVSRPTTSNTHKEGIVSPEGTLTPATAAALMAITQGDHAVSPVTPTASLKANSIKSNKEGAKDGSDGSPKYETPDDIGRSPVSSKDPRE